MGFAMDEHGRHTSTVWHSDTPGELVGSLEESALHGCYFEIDEDDAATLLQYIRGLEADSRALTELRMAIDSEAQKRDLLDRLVPLGAFKLRTFYQYARTDWRAIYGSSGE